MKSNQILKKAFAISKAINDSNWSGLEQLLDESYTYNVLGNSFSKKDYIKQMQEFKKILNNASFEIQEDPYDRFGQVSILDNETRTYLGNEIFSIDCKQQKLKGKIIKKMVNATIVQEWNLFLNFS